jgi:hypothetical protein
MNGLQRKTPVSFARYACIRGRVPILAALLLSLVSGCGFYEPELEKNAEVAVDKVQSEDAVLPRSPDVYNASKYPG